MLCVLCVIAMSVPHAQMTGRTSVPNIWIGQRNVGGCSEGPGVAPLKEQGKLVPMLQAAGAL